MTRTCCECLHYELPDRKVEEAGKCKLSEKRFGREVRLPTGYPACKSFESKLAGQRPGKRR